MAHQVPTISSSQFSNQNRFINVPVQQFPPPNSHPPPANYIGPPQHLNYQPPFVHQHLNQQQHRHTTSHHQVPHHGLNMVAQDMQTHQSRTIHPPPQLNYVQHSSGQKQQSVILMQPPTLHEESLEPSARHFPNAQRQQTQTMTISNHQHSEFQSGFHQEDPQMHNSQSNIASLFWEQRCMTMLGRFEWFYGRFEIIRNEYLSLSEEMQKMDSEDQWHNFQQHHDDFHEKIEEMEQQLNAVMGQNEQLLQQKKQHEGENVWEQRYQEILGNFKNIQEENSQLQEQLEHLGHNSHQANQEKMQEIIESYQELENQYNLAVEEIDRLRNASHHGDEVTSLQEQLNLTLNDISKYKEQLQTLHSQNEEFQNIMIELEKKNQHLQNVNYQASIDRNQYQRIMKVIEEKEQVILRLQNQFKQKSLSSSNHNSLQLQHALLQKNQQIQQLTKIIAEKQKENHDSKNRLLQAEDGLTLSREHLQKEIRQKIFKDKKIAELEKNIQELRQNSQRSQQTTYKVENLQKKLNYTNQEVQNLNETLRKKNQELIEYRGLSFQIQKLKEVQGEFVLVAAEKDKISEILRKKHLQNESLVKEIENLEEKLREATKRRSEFSEKNLLFEIQSLNQTIYYKDAQYAKLRVLLQSKDQFIVKIEEDLKKEKNTILFLEKEREITRYKYEEQEGLLNKQSYLHENRVKDINLQFNNQLKKNLEKEIGELRKDNLSKLQKIKRFQQMLVNYEAKMPSFERERVHSEKQSSILHKKIKDIEEANLQLYQKCDQTFKDLKNRDQNIHHLLTNELSLKNQIIQLKSDLFSTTAFINTKDQAIQSIKNQANMLLEKTSEIQKNNLEKNLLGDELERANIQIEELKEKLNQVNSRSRMISPSNSKSKLLINNNYQKPDFKVIEELAEENKLLKIQIAKCLEALANPSRFSAFQSKPELTEVRALPKNIQNRLFEFNKKLQAAIGGQSQQYISGQSQQYIRNGKDEFREWHQQRRKYEEQIVNLRSQLKLNESQMHEPAGVQNHGNELNISHFQSIFNAEQDNKSKEEIAFFKQKYDEQGLRNQTLLKINEELKSQIDSILKIKEPTTSEFYKQELTRVEVENENLKAKLKKVSIQSKEYKAELSLKNNKSTQELTKKIFELELEKQELQRGLSFLQIQKSAAQNENANLLHSIQQHSVPHSHQPHQSHPNIQQSHQTRQQSHHAIQQSHHSQNESHQPEVEESPHHDSALRSAVSSKRHEEVRQVRKVEDGKYTSIHQQFSSVIGNLQNESSPHNLSSPQSRVQRQDYFKGAHNTNK